jgi:hypothetical protein
VLVLMPGGRTYRIGLFATVGAMRLPALLLALTLLGSAGCDRNLEPYDPDEKASAPDLSKIFPEGAEQAARLEPALPPAPGQGRGAAPMPQEVAESDAASGPPIRGRVEVAPALRDAVPAGAVLFIIGRRDGAGPPLAVKRVASPSFPLTFTLGPEDRMIQSVPFAGPITLSARLDGDGNASSTGPGDLIGTAGNGPVEPGGDALIVLDATVDADASVPAPAGAEIRGSVEIAPAMRDAAPADAVLFIIARSGSGGGPPLAVKREPRPSFPFAFALGPDDRMIPSVPFEGPITLTARLDSDGNASSASPDDLAGEARGGPVDPGAEGVVIVLDRAP